MVAYTFFSLNEKYGETTRIEKTVTFETDFAIHNIFHAASSKTH